MSAQHAFQLGGRPAIAVAIVLCLIMGASLAAQGGPDADIEKIELLQADIENARKLAQNADLVILNDAEARWKAELSAIEVLSPDITESDTEFALRVGKLRAGIEAKRAAEVDGIKADSRKRLEAQTKVTQKELDGAVSVLQAKTWTLSGESLGLTALEFDRNAKIWPLVLECKDPSLTMRPMKLLARLGEAPDPKKDILEMDAAVKAGSLGCELGWGVVPELEAHRYRIDIRSVRVFDAQGKTTFLQIKPNKAAAYFEAGKRGSQVPALEIGDMGPSGGLVFYDKGAFTDGWRYLEVAPQNARDKTVNWSAGASLDVKTGTEIGAGKANTAAIYAARGPTEGGTYAAQVCQYYELNGFTDWFLPSSRELSLIYERLTAAGLCDMDPGFYWSSSQANLYSAYGYIFNPQEPREAMAPKDGLFFVRAIRSF